MDRCALLIDAGHLLAEGGKLCCATKRRAEVVCDYEGIIRALAAMASANAGLPILRTYWYDGARDAIPTLDHLVVAELPNVKLRLGRLSGGKQKGVDALIYRDLMVLGRERAVATAYLLAWDEDLREGVSAAQDMGVRVIVMGIKTGARNQAATLIREADEHLVLDRPFLGRFITKVVSPGPTRAASRDPVRSTAEASASFAHQWLAAAVPEDVQRLLGQAPVIPRELDAQLVKAVSSAVGSGSADLDQSLAKEARRTFWDKVRHAARTAGPPLA